MAGSSAALQRSVGRKLAGGYLGAGLKVSKFGFGGYGISKRLSGLDPEAIATLPQVKLFREALMVALRGGVNVIDTSSSYADGGVETLIGQVVQDAIKQGIVAREDLTIVTKVGHNLNDFSGDAKRFRESFPVPTRGGGQKLYSLNPSFIRHHVGRSCERLQTTPDIVLLHNPDFYLAHAMRGGDAGFVPKDLHDKNGLFYGDKLRRAFQELESLVAEGTIGNSYGVSGNFDGCPWSVTGKRNIADGNSSEALSLSRTLSCAELASEAAGSSRDHKMRTIQIPLNVLELGAAVGTAEKASLLRRAAESGVSVMTNRPLNAICPDGINVGDWGRDSEGSYLPLVDSFPQQPFLALIREVLLQHLQHLQPPRINDESPRSTQPGGPSLASLALHAAALVPNTSVVLSSAHTPAFAQDLVALLQDSRAPVHLEEVYALLDHVQDAVLEARG